MIRSVTVDMSSNKSLSIALCFCLLLALPTMPYFYYQLLRWFVCGSSIYLWSKLGEQGSKKDAYIVLGIAVIFNPLIPFYFGASLWKVIDLVTAIYFLTLVFRTKDN